MGKKSTFSSRFKKLDLYATDVSFRENGGDSFGSIFGACVSLVIILVVAAYGIGKFLVMLDH